MTTIVIEASQIFVTLTRVFFPVITFARLLFNMVTFILIMSDLGEINLGWLCSTPHYSKEYI